MFSSLESIIQKIEGAELMEVWAKYFTDTSPFPKDFFTIFPTLADVHGFFGSFKDYETKTIKKSISNITDKNQLFEILAVKFRLADPINPEAFKVFSRINNLPTAKNAKKSIVYLFEYCIRTLIQLSYQLPSILTIVIEDNKPVPESLVCLHKIVFFFSLFEPDYFLDFHLVLRGLLSHISFRFDQIITNSNPAVQDALLTLMGSLVSVSRVYVSIKPDTESLCVKFITEQLDKIQVLIAANVMSKSIAITIRSTISSLVPGMVNLIPSQRKQLGELAITLIAPILHLYSIDSTEKYQTGIICLKLFHEYCKLDSVNLPKFLLSSLIEFINWLIVTSDISILEENYNLPEKIPEPETLGKLSREDYFADDITLKEGKSIILTKRLSVVADIIVSIIMHFKDPSPFVSNLINSIKEQEELIEPALYRPYVAFVLYLLMKIHECIVVEAIKDNWQLLLSEKLFPYDTTLKSDTNLQYAVMILSYRAFINSPESRQTILSCLSRYFETNAEAGVTYFWRYLNMMLIVADSTDFIPNIANSKLIHKIVLLSANNLGVFNFLRTCIFIKPAPLLMRQDVLDFMIENCEREKYIDSIASLYMIGFSLLDDGQSSWQVVSALMKSTSKRLASLENVKVSLSIVDFAFGKVQSWPPKLVDSIACKRFCEAVASIPVNHFSVDNYIRVIKSFTNVSRMNPNMFFLITQPDVTIYDKLKVFPKNVKDEDIEIIIKTLFEFSFSSRTTKSNGHYIRNYKVIEIITEWVRGTKFESYAFKEFNILAMKSIGNIFQLNRAHIPEYILERLEDIGDNISVISDLLSLFTQLCMYVFTTAILYSGIRLMRSKKFHYPNLILSTFFRLLTDEQLQGPTSFFHFDGTATGIFDAEVVINDKDCLFMTLRIDQNFDMPAQPILSITNDAGENLLLTLQQNKLQASMLFQKGTTKQEGTNIIEHNAWFSIAVVFTQKVISVYYNNNLDMTLLPMSLFKKNKIFIASIIDSMQSNGMIGDVGPVVIIKNGDPNKLSMKLSANEITDKYGNDVTLKITSRTTLQNTVLNVSELSQSVNFRGQAIPTVSTIVDSFIAVSSIPNLLPLIQRLRYCDNCKGFHSDYCNLCGGLASEHGSEMLITLLQVIIRLLQKFPSLLSTFKSIRGEKLICGFLQNINQSYLDDRSLNTLADLYKISKDPEFSQQLIEELYLSVDFIKTLPQDMQEYYFKTVLINLWNYNKVPFQSFPSLDFMICRAMNLTTFNVYCHNHMWSFILKMVTTNLAPVFTTTIISIISKISDQKILSPLLDLFLGLIDDTMTQSCSSTLSIFDYYLPFVYCLQIPDSKIQNKILHIIARLSVSNSKLEQYMYIAALTHVKSDDPVLFVETLNSMMFWNNCPEMLPLFIKSMKEVPIDKSMEIYIDFVTLIKSQTNPEKSLIRLANWYHLVMDLSMIFYQPNSSLISIIEPILYLIVLSLKNKKANDLTELMIYLDIFEMTNNISISEVKKIIFFHILKNQELMSRSTQNNSNSSGGGLFEAVFPTIMAEIFKFIFIHQNNDKKVDAYSAVTKEIAKFVPEQKYFPSIVDFDIIIENGKWKDLDLATELLKQINNMFSFDISISDSITINSFPTISYIISLVAKFDKDLFIKATNSLLDIYPKIGYDEAYESSNIILHTINKNNIKFDKIEKLNKFVTFYTDDDDSPELQYFMFEDKFTYDNGILQGIVMMQQSSLIQNMCSKLEIILKIEDISKLKNKDDLPLIDRIFRLNNGQVLALINGAYDRIIMRQKNLDLNWHLSLSKYLSSFMRELSISGGPWTNKMSANHYKMSCYLSKSGQKVVLKLNNKFDDHKKASELRDQGESTSEMSILPRFKQMSASVSVSRLDGYHCLVQMISLSSFSSGEIFYSKNLITFITKSPENQKFIEINLSDVEFIMNRKQSHQEIACEIFMNTNRSYYFIFANQDEKSQFLKMIQNDFTFTKSDNLDPSKFHFFNELRKVNNSIVQVLSPSEICEKLKLSELWQKYKFTNFEYLFYLNILSGRSFNDLSQYPVYPWVIKDYESEKISLSNEKIFRDLSKPIGALNPKRIKDLTELYKDFPIEEEKCLYRSFYSTMASVSSFMIRTEPFTSSHIQLQEGRFDVAGRLFHSILMEWKAVTSEENDFRELIPEFFCFPDFLTNDNNFDLGQRMKSDGSFEKVDDVILPKWCKTTRQFIFTNREALESDYVSQNLNNWIDLVFGVYRNSIEKQNVFHPLCYPENNFQVNDRLRNHCLNFGVCPDQLFFENHPKRTPNFDNLTDVTFSNSFDIPISCIMKNFIFLQGNLYIDARNIFTKGEKNMSIPKRIPGNYGEVICCSKYHGIVVFKRPFDDFVTAVELEKEAVRRISHDGNGVTCCNICGGKYMITGGNDCSLVIWSLPSFSPLRTSMIHGSPIIAVGGNNDLGIVASLDKQGLLILETIVNGRFLCSTNVLVGQSKPSILIFKSGLIILAVCNYHSTVLNLFDTKLQEISNLELSGCASDVTKITDDRGCEFIALVIEKAIIVIEAYSLKLLLTIPTEFQSPHVGSCRKQRLLLVGDGREFRTVMF